MKLRNKNTGEIVIFGRGVVDLRKIRCKNVAEMLEKGWEDFKVAEPLIKDEKVRNAVNAWAKANDLFEIQYDKTKDCLYAPTGSDETDTCVSISFDTYDIYNKLEHRQLYAIDELCGEDEE